MNEFKGKQVLRIVKDDYVFEIYFTDGSAIRVLTKNIFVSELEYQIKKT